MHRPSRLDVVAFPACTSPIRFSIEQSMAPTLRVRRRRTRPARDGRVALRLHPAQRHRRPAGALGHRGGPGLKARARLVSIQNRMLGIFAIVTGCMSRPSVSGLWVAAVAIQSGVPSSRSNHQTISSTTACSGNEIRPAATSARRQHCWNWRRLFRPYFLNLAGIPSITAGQSPLRRAPRLDGQPRLPGGLMPCTRAMLPPSGLRS